MARRPGLVIQFKTKPDTAVLILGTGGDLSAEAPTPVPTMLVAGKAV